VGGCLDGVSGQTAVSTSPFPTDIIAMLRWHGSHTKLVLLYAAGWSWLLLFRIAGVVMMPRMPVIDGITEAFADIGLAALLGIPVWRLSSRLDGFASLARAIPLYASAGVVFSIADAVGTRVIEGHALHRGSAGFVLSLDSYHFVGALFLYTVLAVGIVGARAYGHAESNRLIALDAERARIVADSMRVRAELKSIRAHLNPHFLFNTLNAIAATVEVDPPTARQMLIRAAALLRRVLDFGATGDDVVTVADEWATVSDYLSLERLRMGDRLRIDARFTDDALACEIPAFLIQPLVENAIRHGLFPKPEGGTLRISGAIVGDKLLIEVEDDGAGAAASILSRASGFGLRAARERIHCVYRESGRVEIVTAPGKGFRVRLTLSTCLPDETTDSLIAAHA
jgi:signal transduction histidine kinase